MKKYTLQMSFCLILFLIPLLTSAQQGDVDNSGDESCAILSINLRYGAKDSLSNGNSVSILQDFLYSNGYLSTAPTGFFGGMTRSAVIAFQKKYGLSARPLGYVGAMTRAKIIAIDCNNDGNTVVSPISPSPVPVNVQPSVSLLEKTPVINSIQSPGNPEGVISSNERATIYGKGLSGKLTIKIGSQEVQTLTTVGVSDTYAEFIVPTRSQTVATSITVTNSSGSISNFYQVKITVPTSSLDITTTSLTNMKVGVSQANYIYATGAVSDISWGVVSGSLPPGTSLDKTGKCSNSNECITISGTPIAAGTYSFFLQAASVSQSSSRQFTLIIEPALVATILGNLTIDPSSVSVNVGSTLRVKALFSSSCPSGVVCVLGPVEVFPTWKISDTSIAKLNQATPRCASGSVCPSPTTDVQGVSAGTTLLSAEYQDSNGARYERVATVNVIGISNPTPSSISITTTSLTNMKVGVSQANYIYATGAVSDISWSVVSGSLPPGTSLDKTGKCSNSNECITISGTPIAAGTYSFFLQAASGKQFSSRQFTLTVDPALVVTPSNRSPIGTVDAGNCSIIGGWAFDQDNPTSEIGIHVYRDGPAGSGIMDQNTTTTGLRSDVNAAYGVSGNHGFTFTTSSAFKDGANHTYYVYGIDANGGTNALVGSGTISGCMLAPTPVPSPTPVPPPTPVSITTSSLANAKEGTAYSAPLSATGGNGTFSWSFASGQMPLGLSVSGGAISGTPVTYGTFIFALQATSDGRISSKQFTLTVDQKPPEPTIVSSSNYIGYLDAADCNIIGGWSLNQSNSSAPTTIRVYDETIGNQILVYSGETTGLRTDINAAYGVSGNHGFTITTPSVLKDGTSRLVKVYTMVNSTSMVLVSGSPRGLNCPSSNLSQNTTQNSKQMASIMESFKFILEEISKLVK